MSLLYRDVRGFFFGVALASAVGVASTSTNTVSISPDPESLDLAKNGRADIVRDTCQETLKFQKDLAEQYKKVSGGKQETVILGLESCETALQAQESIRAGVATRAIAAP